MTAYNRSENALVLRRKVDGYVAERNMIRARLTRAECVLANARKKQRDIDVVQNTLQYVATRVQNNFGNYIGGIVTKAIHHVFRETSSEHFIVRFRENRGKTEAVLRIRTEKGSESHPFHCSGGGMWDVIALALRSACLVMEQPAASRFLVLDEPFKFLHGRNMRRRAMQMLYNTCNTLGIQAIVVHQTDGGSELDESLELLVNKHDCSVYEVRLKAYEESEVVRYGG